MTTRMGLTAGVAMLTLSVCGVAQAQTAPAVDGQERSSDQLDEVVVTAERQSRNLQTPTSGKRSGSRSASSSWSSR